MPGALRPGCADTLVPEVMKRALAGKMLGEVWQPVSGGGHCTGVSQGNDILALAATELAAPTRAA